MRRKLWIYPILGLAGNFLFGSCSNTGEEDFPSSYVVENRKMVSSSVGNSAESLSGSVIRGISVRDTVPTGYDEMKVTANLKKVLVTNLIAQTIHITPGVYFGKTVFVIKHLTCKPYSYILPPEGTTTFPGNTGLVSADVLSSTPVFGWKSSKVKDREGSGTFNGETYLLYLYANSSGKKVNYYYPCSPEKLKWHFEEE